MAVPDELDLFRAHFEKLPGAAFIWQRDGDDFRVIATNFAGEHFGDSRVAGVIGCTSREMSEFDPDFHDHLHRAVTADEILEKEGDVRFVAGLVRRVVTTFVPLSPDIVVVHARDVTDQRALERRLRESEARLRALIEAIPDSILRMDADARILDVHYPRSLDPPPWDPTDLIGRKVGEFYGPQAQELQSYYNREAIRTGAMQIFEIRLPGAERPVHLESRVVRIDDREVVVTSRDVSERAELEGRQVIREQQERSRLSREIHDGLAQLLTGANLQLEHVARCLADSGLAHADALESVAGLIRQAVGQARDLSRGLSPVPHGTQLFEALKLAAHHAERSLGLMCRFTGEGRDEDIGQLAVAHLYRIAQESITNAVRHGFANEIELRCVIDDERLTLSIEDDGRGMPDGDVDTRGIGLRNMRYRARALGGELRLDGSVAGGGARVRCVCPLPAVRDTDWSVGAA